MSLAIDRDRISDLHESNICHILSRLPTKHAIQTTVLSKAWKHKWTSLYNVDFVIHDFNMKDKALKKSFYNTIDRIIAVSKQLKSFRLEYGSVHGLHWKINGLQKLVSAMERSNLESFQVRYYNPSNYIDYQVNLLSSTSLRHLKLEHSPATLNVSMTNCAPNLTSLCLFEVRIMNGSYNLPNSTSVTFTFPVLETFEARYIEFVNMKCVEIYAPVLTNFSFVPRGVSWEKLHYSFVLVAPMLTKFGYDGNLPEVFTLKYPSSIFSASFLNSDDHDCLMPPINMSRVGEILNRFINLKVLTVSPYVAKELLSGSPLHRHDKLKTLVFTNLRIGQQLLDLLEASPTLEFLIVDVSHYMRVYGEYEETTSLVVPSCIVFHLKKVSFTGFVRSKLCYTLAKFMLKNGKMLKKIAIYNVGQEMEIDNLRNFFSTLHQFRPDVRIDIAQRNSTSM